MQFYEGKAKIIKDVGIDQAEMIFKNDLTAFDGVKHAQKQGKGLLNKQITVKLFNLLQTHGIPTHFLRDLEDREEPAILVKKVQILPVEVVIRNVVAGSFARRYGLPKGQKLQQPLLEYFVKSDELHDPLIIKEAAILLDYITSKDHEVMKLYAHAVNHILKHFFKKVGLDLIDFKLEFGKTPQGDLVLADEITPDSMRLWKQGTQESWDKDVFREDKGDVIATYSSLWDLISKTDTDSINIPPFHFVAKLTVHLKDGIVDAQGDVTKRALERKGFNAITAVQMGKSILLTLETTNLSKTLMELHQHVKEFLTNPLIEKVNLEYLV